MLPPAVAVEPAPGEAANEIRYQFTILTDPGNLSERENFAG